AGVGVTEVSRGRVIVTGASRGIGRAVAELLLARGAHVALVARDEARLAEVASRGEGRAHVVVADLAASGAARTAVDRAAAALGGVDGLVCAAGIVRRA